MQIMYIVQQNRFNVLNFAVHTHIEISLGHIWYYQNGVVGSSQMICNNSFHTSLAFTAPDTTSSDKFQQTPH